MGPDEREKWSNKGSSASSKRSSRKYTSFGITCEEIDSQRNEEFRRVQNMEYMIEDMLQTAVDQKSNFTLTFIFKFSALICVSRIVSSHFLFLQCVLLHHQLKWRYFPCWDRNVQVQLERRWEKQSCLRLTQVHSKFPLQASTIASILWWTQVNFLLDEQLML